MVYMYMSNVQALAGIHVCVPCISNRLMKSHPGCYYEYQAGCYVWHVGGNVKVNGSDSLVRMNMVWWWWCLAALILCVSENKFLIFGEVGHLGRIGL